MNVKLIELTKVLMKANYLNLQIIYSTVIYL